MQSNINQENQIVYWDGVLDPNKTLETTYGTIIRKKLQALLSGEILPSKKIVPHSEPIYGVDLNYSARLLYTEIEIPEKKEQVKEKKVKNKRYILITDLLPQHNYKDAIALNPKKLFPFLKKNKYYNNLADLALPETPQEINEDLNPLSTELSLSSKEIVFSKKQLEVLDKSNEVTLVLGSAGAGKSALTQNLMEKAFYEGHRMLIIAPIQVTKRMASHLETLHIDSGVTERNIQCMTYEEFILSQLKLEKESDPELTCVGFNEFKQWFDNQKIKISFKDFYNKTEPLEVVIYRELKRRAANKDYDKLGPRGSCISKDGDAKKIVEEIYHQYSGELKKKNQIDPALMVFSFEQASQKEFASILLEEAQDLPPTACETISNFAKKNINIEGLSQLYILVDIYQDTTSHIFDLDCLPKFGDYKKVVLEENYRIPEENANLINALMFLINALYTSELNLPKLQGRNGEKGNVRFTEGSDTQRMKQLKELASSPQTVVIVPSGKHKEKAKELYETELIVTPDEIKGAQFDYVICDDFFNDDRLKTIEKLIQTQQLEEKFADWNLNGNLSNNRSKDKEAPHLYTLIRELLNSLYTALSRSRLGVEITARNLKNHVLLKFLKQSCSEQKNDLTLQDILTKNTSDGLEKMAEDLAKTAPTILEKFNRQRDKFNKQQEHKNFNSPQLPLEENKEEKLNPVSNQTNKNNVGANNKKSKIKSSKNKETKALTKETKIITKEEFIREKYLGSLKKGLQDWILTFYLSDELENVNEKVLYRNFDNLIGHSIFSKVFFEHKIEDKYIFEHFIEKKIGSTVFLRWVDENELDSEGNFDPNSKNKIFYEKFEPVSHYFTEKYLDTTSTYLNKVLHMLFWFRLTHLDEKSKPYLNFLEIKRKACSELDSAGDFYDSPRFKDYLQIKILKSKLAIETKKAILREHILSSPENLWRSRGKGDASLLYYIAELFPIYLKEEDFFEVAKQDLTAFKEELLTSYVEVPSAFTLLTRTEEGIYILELLFNRFELYSDLPVETLLDKTEIHFDSEERHNRYIKNLPQVQFIMESAFHFLCTSNVGCSFLFKLYEHNPLLFKRVIDNGLFNWLGGRGQLKFPNNAKSSSVFCMLANSVWGCNFLLALLDANKNIFRNISLESLLSYMEDYHYWDERNIAGFYQKTYFVFDDLMLKEQGREVLKKLFSFENSIFDEESFKKHFRSVFISLSNPYTANLLLDLLKKDPTLVDSITPEVLYLFLKPHQKTPFTFLMESDAGRKILYLILENKPILLEKATQEELELIRLSISPPVSPIKIQLEAIDKKSPLLEQNGNGVISLIESEPVLIGESSHKELKEPAELENLNTDKLIVEDNSSTNLTATQKYTDKANLPKSKGFFGFVASFFKKGKNDDTNPKEAHTTELKK